MWKRRSIKEETNYAGEVVVVHLKTIKQSFFRKKYQMYVACQDILDEFTRMNIFRYIEEDIYDNMLKLIKDNESVEIKFLFVGPIFKNSSKDFTRTFAYAFGLRINDKAVQKYKAKKMLSDVCIDWVFD